MNEHELKNWRTDFEKGRNFYHDKDGNKTVNDTLLESSGFTAGVCMAAFKDGVAAAELDFPGAVMDDDLLTNFVIPFQNGYKAAIDTMK